MTTESPLRTRLRSALLDGRRARASLDDIAAAYDVVAPERAAAARAGIAVLTALR